MQDAFDKRFFSQRDNFHIPYFDDETGEKKKAPVNFLYKVALNSWLSSPAALTEAIKHNLATPDSARPQLKIFAEEVSPENDEENELVAPSGAYNLPLEESLDKRKQALNPVLSTVSRLEVNDDKFIKLIDIIDRHHVQVKGKVLVFIRRHTTALYLFTRLSIYYKESVNLGCTVEKLNGSIRLTSRSKGDKLLFQFSPSSFPERKKPDVSIDVLICTDADGLGVDLPEADTIVNYDIPEGADVLFQRAGRILRMTIQKNRHVHFYTFVPTIFNNDISESSCHHAVIGKFNRLIKRHQNASKILDGDVLSDQTEFNILLNDKVINDIENFMKQADMSEDLLTPIKNTKLEHELVLLEYKETCKNLPCFVHSARYHQAGTYLVFLLISWNERLWPILYNAGTKTIDLQHNELNILNRIACTPDTEKAFIPISVVEKLCDYALEAWCASEPEQARNIEEARKWCAMILLPKPTSHEEAMNNFARLIDANRSERKTKKRPEKKSQKGILNLFND